MEGMDELLVRLSRLLQGTQRSLVSPFRTQLLALFNPHAGPFRESKASMLWLRLLRWALASCFLGPMAC